ncbi:hypothetical protein RUE5091_03730 [Ruegeria denitrificans]|uniref:Uncharacterized protein n=1 Tax=Ruegeria denitrificans TaxID=1715692 RepID=A0A0P1II68_9RHOB|nr:hypothetical protein RUE5091_03730 [Ruegeria denitrificans]
MKTNSIFSRFKLTKTRPSGISKNDLSSEFGRRLPRIKKSELKALFHTVLEEKRDDLPPRRR